MIISRFRDILDLRYLTLMIFIYLFKSLITRQETFLIPTYKDPSFSHGKNLTSIVII